MHAPRKPTLAQRLIRSRFFLFALLIHLLIFIMLATVVVFRTPPIEKEPQSVLLPPEPDPVKIPETPIPVDDVTPPPINSGRQSQLDPIVINRPDPSSISIPQLSVKIEPRAVPKAPPPIGNPIEQRLPEIGKTVKLWKPPGSSRYEIKIHIARYAQGDWNTGLPMKEGRIVGGAIDNLAASMMRMTRGKVQAEVVPVPLNLASAEILDNRPPFIFFTGHKDFTLTDAEVENLRKYLILGGAIWADNGLAGRGSRFDVAFRREMKRVLVSKDQNFEELPDDHHLFTKGYFPVRELPTGMNFVREPVEAIFLDGQLAVIYTLNDYTDMLRMLFEPDMITPNLTPSPTREFVTPGDLWQYRNVYYRNFTPESCAQSYRFSANIILYLLTRFDDLLSFGAVSSR